MEKDPLISIIIPVYNTEVYLEQCVSSVMKQTYDNIEIILVDDGSYDRSGVICDKLAGQDKRIIVIHKENGGPSSSKKAGVKAASSDYICFVDSDDWIDREMIRYFVNKLKEYEPDIVASAVIWEMYSGQKKWKEKNELREGIYQEESLKKEFYPHMLHYAGNYKFGILQYLCGKLFKKGIILKVLEEVDERIWAGEDVACLYDACLSAKRILVDNSYYYHYRQGREGSLCSRIYGDEHFTNARLLYSYMKNKFEHTEYKEILLPQLSQYIFAVINKLTKEVFDYDMAEEWRLPVDLIAERPCFILYGAGAVGKSYLNQIKHLDFVNMIAWVDKNYNHLQQKGLNVEAPAAIQEKEYDMVLIAVSELEAAQEIKDQLLGMGIHDSKICWKETERIFNSYALRTY